MSPSPVDIGRTDAAGSLSSTLPTGPGHRDYTSDTGD